MAGSTGECGLLCGASQGLKDWVGLPVSDGRHQMARPSPISAFGASTRV